MATRKSRTWSRGAMALAAALTAGAGACRSYPEISYRQTRLADVTRDRMRLIFDLDVVNTGRYTYVLTDCQYRLKIAGQQYVRGRREEYLQLSPGEPVRWAFPIDVDVNQMFQLIQPTERGTYVPFELDLDCGYRTHPGVGRWSVWFNTTGALPLPALPKLRLDRVVVTHLSDEQAAVVAEVVVSNTNDEPLMVLAMQYALTLAGYEMGTGTLPEPKTVPAAGSLRLRLGASSTVMGARFGLGRRLMQRQISYTLRGQTPIETPLRMPWSFAVNGTVPLVQSDRP